MKILILCTGNSCRSQMAEGFLNKKFPEHEIYSAGVQPAAKVSSKAIKVMKEIDIDISKQKTKDVSIFLNQSFDYVITVCNNANETCPYFTGKVNHRLHFPFYDPSEAIGSEDEVLEAFRKVRDEIIFKFTDFINSIKQ